MPMLDVYIPQGALSAQAESALIAKVSDLLLEHDGVDPANQRARPLSWVFVHRPDVYVAGARPRTPRYRFICQVPEGQYSDERRAAVIAGMTQAVAEAEAGAWPHPERRVCIFTCEVPDGWWGGAGRILRLPDIYQLIWPLGPDTDGDPRQAAHEVLAARRRDQAEQLLADAGPRPAARAPETADLR
jgi:phenylpyruvate tautomerase PptA (4-oxalocrotonate tautomerase family)